MNPLQGFAMQLLIIMAQGPGGYSHVIQKRMLLSNTDSNTDLTPRSHQSTTETKETMKKAPRSQPMSSPTPGMLESRIPGSFGHSVPVTTSPPLAMPIDDGRPLRPISLLAQPGHYGPPALFFSSGVDTAPRLLILVLDWFSRVGSCGPMTRTTSLCSPTFLAGWAT